MNFEKYKLSQGNIMIAFSDKNLSIGVLEINPGQEMAKHNRPVLESLYQISGSCLMKIFSDDEKITEKILQVGDSLDIEPNKYHIHTNPFEEKSITLWKASGDITEIIENIRKNSEL
jgi:quercetin dioxygenase-like cupin family protein